MKRVPPLLPIFRSRAQAALLTRVLMNPDQESSVTALARDLGVSVATASREVNRAQEAGLVRTTKVGNTRLVSAAVDSLLYRPMADLLVLAFGPPAVVAEEFRDLAGVRELYLFGSWAARQAGQPGPKPRDIDVLVVGSVDRDEVFEAARRVEKRIGRPVNAIVRAPERWEGGSDAFLRELKSRPLLAVPLDGASRP